MPKASAGRRAASYWFVDGLPDIVLGMTLLLFGALGLGLCMRMRKPTTWLDLYSIEAGLILVLWKGRNVVDFLKSRVTYPRTGYVQPPQDIPEMFVGQPSLLIALSLRPGPPPDENVTRFDTRTVLVVFWWSVILFVAAANPWHRWYTPFAMLPLAIALYGWNRRTERPYQWWSALILALTGPMLMSLDLGPLLEPLLLPLLAGAWLVTNGAFTLVRYLRANPYPRAAEGVRA
ncbi:MAG: hypothetical protein WBL61_06630 [Bryobacteraceae bacterium]